MQGHEVRKLTLVEDWHWWYAERRHILAGLIEGMTPGLVCDIGAAGGGNTRVLVENGWRAAAVEYGADGAEVAHSRGLDVLRADATRFPLATDSLDLVTALDVLEHIPDDDAAVREIRRVLRPGGQAIIAVPCDPKLWSAHDVAVDHVRRYTQETLRSLFERNGMDVVECWSWMVLLRPAVKLRRRSSSGSDLDNPSPFVNAALSTIVKLERHLPVRRLPGVTLWLRATVREN
ncbi:bifunctional 2-polyprenyl-6-hydroxyphenol methylase/3-demethylubiquinol 3-O-methyltransferase UbiG [Allobranchiibius sp. CTAmp26]|uniref:class I SAM-dependent methyltransferase n=1 Tax=Allobranchiibius sp. CTAmp26 TaxID=2815214 RepID=UPI001AA16EC8|nr:class I SAM-dependent methyltransferase [Allobranchiibius sp. CTAmp26]MBO1755218.1 class I SAM-dependent methyltransferase [Allobranchiibius sp. CTAmp26]